MAETHEIMYFKSQYSRSRFFAPPPINKLNLDLACLDGGGYAPAQFYGRTHEGREVYCRYRGGWLSVTIANAPGADCLNNGTDVLEVQLGPPLHGGLTLGQLCHYAGITIDGTMPSLPTPEEMIEHSAKDLGGDWSFFDVWVNSTHATQRLFLERFLRAFGDCQIIQPIFTPSFSVADWQSCSSIDEIKEDFFSALFTAGREKLPDLQGKTSLNHLEAFVVHIQASGFKYPLRKYASNDDEWVEKNWGLKIEIAGQCDAMLHGSFSLHASFKNDDADAHRCLQILDSLVDEVYPAFHVVEVDIATLEKCGGKQIGHFDPAIARWIDEDDRRWLFVRRDGDRENPRAVGQRLATVEFRPLET